MEAPKNSEKRERKETGSREASVTEPGKDAPSEKKEKKEKKHKDKERKEKDKKEKEHKGKKEKKEKRDRSVQKEKTTDADSAASQTGSVIVHQTPTAAVADSRAKKRLSLPVKAGNELSPVASFDFDHQLPSTRFPSNEPMPTMGSSEEDDSSSSRRPPAAAQLRRASYRRTTSDVAEQIASAGVTPSTLLSANLAASTSPRRTASPASISSSGHSTPYSASPASFYSPAVTLPSDDTPTKEVRRGAVKQVVHALPNKEKDVYSSDVRVTPEKLGIAKRSSGDVSLGSGSKTNPRLSTQFELSDLNLQKKDKEKTSKERGAVKSLFDKLSRRKSNETPDAEPETSAAKVFGVALGALETATHQELLLPVALVRLTTWLIDHRGVDQDGIFRIAGRSNEIAAITAAFDEGNYVIPDGVDPHSVSGMVKLFFKLLPDPLFTVAHYTQWVELIRVMDNDRRLLLARELIAQLPSLNRNLIVYFLKFLLDVSLRRAQNRMTAAALGTVFGPFLIRPTSQHQEQVDISTFHQATSLLKWLIENAEEVVTPPELSPLEQAQSNHRHRHRRQHSKSKPVDLPRLAIETVKPTIERKNTNGTLPPAVPLLSFSTPSQAALAPPKRSDPALSPPQMKRKGTGTEADIFALVPSPRGRRLMDSPDAPPRRWPLPALSSELMAKPTPVGTPRQQQQQQQQHVKHSDLPPGFWKYLILSIACVIVITTVMRAISRLLTSFGW